MRESIKKKVIGKLFPMKKIIFFFMTLLLLSFVVVTPSEGGVLDLDGKYYVTYAGSTALVACKKESIPSEGVASIVISMDYTQWDKVKSHFSTIDRVEKLENMTILYGYNPTLTDYYYLDGEKTNLQIVLKEIEVMIGYPIIFAGF